MRQDDVKEFLTKFREIRQTRAISGADLTIPVVFLDLIAENMYRYSKLMNRVRVRNVNGQARQTIAGIAPEAVWTEMCGAINELEFGFNQITVDGYKVAGYIPVCNSLLEDSDIALASWIVEMISESLGYAKDKAILYGKERGFQDAAGYCDPPRRPPRLGLSGKCARVGGSAHLNVIQIDDELTGAAFWSAPDAGDWEHLTRYSRGNQFWAMNSKTYALLKSKVITFTATGDIVSNVFGTLPIINGDIDILSSSRTAILSADTATCTCGRSAAVRSLICPNTYSLSRTTRYTAAKSAPTARRLSRARLWPSTLTAARLTTAMDFAAGHRK